MCDSRSPTEATVTEATVTEATVTEATVTEATVTEAGNRIRTEIDEPRREGESVSDAMQKRLQDYFRSSFPDKAQLRVTAPLKIKSGWESDLVSFETEHGPAEARQRDAFVARLYQNEQLRGRADNESRYLQRLHDSGYPVPRVFVLNGISDAFQKPCVVMERVSGQAMGEAFSKADEPKQRRLVSLFSEMLARLHQLSTSNGADPAFETGTVEPSSFVDRALHRASDALAPAQTQCFLPVVDWLRSHPEVAFCQRPTFVHGDFHPNNVLLRENGDAIVIDWAEVEVSDPRFDLAWTLLTVATHSGNDWRDAILNDYQNRCDCETGQLEWFETYACLRRLRVAALTLPDHMADSAGTSEIASVDPASLRREIAAVDQIYSSMVVRTGIRVMSFEERLARLR
jgi:aminoglycoside phosphotransferase (APT) family kinase protein